MQSRLTQIITARDTAQRNQPLETFCREADMESLLAECRALDAFRRQSDNLYERVRALFFLYAIHRFHLPEKPGLANRGWVPFEGFNHLLNRRFEEAVEVFLQAAAAQGINDTLCSALAAAYHQLGFQTLVNQVRRSVRSVRGNQWMFRTGHPADHPLRIRPELRRRSSEQDLFPLLRERTPVRMDLSHSGWSDIFFLGMDYPEGARVLNVSIDLGVRGVDTVIRPPVEAYLRVIDEPVLRLASVDLGATATISNLAEVFDFAKDYLGLLKAAVIAAGIIPPGMEGSGESLADLLARMLGPGLGLEVVSCVNNIPKGSRLAVSTSLLAAIITVCMRATGQIHALTGPLQEEDRRLVAARAILGEWLGGSGGGWQDSGGIWPGIKLIEGVQAGEGDPEFGISRGRLLPNHHLLGPDEVPEKVRSDLQNSLVLVHGGMAQNVGPILEMVTEKYLLRSAAEWEARQEAMALLNHILETLKRGEILELGRATTRNFFGPIQTVIPRATNAYTETLIDQVRARFGDRFWGFWMLGGMSGGGMGFIFDPAAKAQAPDALQEIMSLAKREMAHALPFAMDPVVYDFAINSHGTLAELREGPEAMFPPGYYEQVVPDSLRTDLRHLSPTRRRELEHFGAACRTRVELNGMIERLFDRLFPRPVGDKDEVRTLDDLCRDLGFDRELHETIRADLVAGHVGLAQNRFPSSTLIEDVTENDVIDTTRGTAESCRSLGEAALAQGAVACVTLAAGLGSRWTQGAGVVKALNPFCQLAGGHRTFIEVHLAKSRRVSREYGVPLPHILTTSYLTHDPIAAHLARQNNYSYPGPLYLSPGRTVGLRMIPTERDLRFAWEEMPQQILDEQAQKVRDSLHAALIGWARTSGEGQDYRDNLPLQCLNPVGHWFEVPNLLRNGVLSRLLAEQPSLRHLMLHNIDTLGADLDPALLGLHIRENACLSFEVIPRRIEDRGGGLARVNGQVRLIEGLALPREEQEFLLSYYNSMTTWIDIDALLDLFGLDRARLDNSTDVAAAVRRVGNRMPTYITLKDVKKRWGHGQEDIFPVAQYEKLWGDMTALSGLACRFFVVNRFRGQQLKDPAQLDGWLRDGSARYIETVGQWQ
jgi:hypothetical protein